MDWRSVCLAGFVMILPVSATFAVDQRYDRSIEAAATRIAASKLGTIRGSIGFDEDADYTRNSKPQPVAPAPKPDPLKISKVSPSEEFFGGIDPTITASINKRPEKIVWDRFDRYGNPIE